MAVLAYSVSLRRHEFGIRIALGSRKSALIALVLRQAAYPVLLGTALGLTMALIALRWVRGLLYQTPVMDPLAVGGSVMLLLVAASDSSDCPGPTRSIHRPDARTENGVAVVMEGQRHSVRHEGQVRMLYTFQL